MPIAADSTPQAFVDITPDDMTLFFLSYLDGALYNDAGWPVLLRAALRIKPVRYDVLREG